MTQPQWQFYLSPSNAWFAMLEACNNATSSIDLEQYIFDLDSIGKRFLEVCIKKAREGVKVRIICDAVGSYKMFISRIPSILEKAGVQIVFHNSFIIGTPGHYTTWFFRDHRKLLVVDNKIGFTGGICLRDEMENWRDTHVRIEGGVVEQMSRTFTDMWNRAQKIKSKVKNRFKYASINEFSYVPHLPLPRRRHLYYLLLDSIRRAQKYVYLTTPYFLPSHRLLKALKQAKKRGVDVKILLPEHSDHPIVDRASHTFFAEVLKAGIRIFQYRNPLHAKTIVIDDAWSTVGSLNLDNVSLRYNFEANLVSTDPKFIQDVKSHFQEDITVAKELTIENWNKRSYISQFVELIMWPIRKLL